MEKIYTPYPARNGLGTFEWMVNFRWVVVFLTLSMSTIFGQVSAQEKRISLKVEHKTLIEVMDLLKAKTGCSFVFSAGDVEGVSGISLDVKDKTLTEILSMALKGSGLVYTVEGNLIILKRQARQVQRQAREARVLTGVVTGTGKRDTLPGVTVIIKGTSVGVVTDVHGRYKISLPEGEDISLIFTFIGKRSKTIAYTGQKELNVVLEDDVHEVEEVIVTGYQNLDKRKATTSITQLKAEDIMVAGMSSIDQMLESHVPGMIFMQNSGQVGAAPRLRVRGTSTILGSQEPLWVVDGVVVTDPVNVDPDRINDLDFVNLLGNAISGLNPYDIEDINVLKDASATALYGTQAANGVIVVTTKKGKRGPLSVRYHVDGTFSPRPRYTDRSIYLMNSLERVAYSREAIEKGLEYASSVDGWGGYEALVQSYNKNEISRDEFQNKVSELETMNTDWLGTILRDAFSHKHTLSLSGGADKMNYYASVGYNRSTGVLKKEYGDNYTSIVKVSFQEKNFNAEFKLSGNIKEQHHTPEDVKLLDNAYSTSRAFPLHDENGDLYYYKTSKNNYPVYFNVLNERDHSSRDIEGSTVSFMTNLQYKFLENLKAQVTFSYNLSNTEENVYHGPETAYAAGYAQWQGDPRYDEFSPKQGRNEVTWPMGGELIRDYTKNRSYTLRGQVGYHHYLDRDKDHMMSYDAGLELSSTRYTGSKKAFRNYFPDRGLIVNQVDYKLWPGYANWLATDVNARGVLKDRLTNKMGAYATATYSFRNTYILNANMRVDFSNEFGNMTNDKFLPVWSFSGRWNMKENILANVNFVNDLSLRASFGYQGNISSEASPELLLVRGEMNPIFNEPSSTIKQFPNPDLGWEKTASFNSQIDFALFNNVLKGTVSYFYKKTTNAYLGKKVARVNGVSSYTVNEGTVENQGLELSLKLVPFDRMVQKVSDATSASGERKGFRWSIDPQLGQIVNKLLDKVTSGSKFNTVHDEFAYTDYLNGTAYVTGRPLNSFFSYEFTGLDPVDGRPTFARTGEEMFDQYIDMTKAGVYTTVMKYSGSRVPYLQGGLTSTLEYGNLILSFNFAYSIGSKIRLLKLYDEISTTSAVPSPVKNMRKEFVDRWQRPGDEKYTNIPGLLEAQDYKGSFNPWWSQEPYKFAEHIWQMYDNSNVRVVNGDYLKLQSLSLRYVFPKRLCHKMGVKNMYMSLSGSNLFTLCSKDLKGQEPTQSGSANQINLGVRPTYSVSIDVTF